MLSGIDPGLSGAVAVLAPDGTLEGLHDTLILTLSTSRGTHQAYHMPGLVALLIPYVSPQAHIFLEESQAKPGQETRSTFTVGLGFGIWLGVLAVLALPPLLLLSSSPPHAAAAIARALTNATTATCLRCIESVLFRGPLGSKTVPWLFASVGTSTPTTRAIS